MAVAVLLVITFSEPYPQGVNAPIQYGARLEAYVAYLSVYQYLPYQGLCLLLKDVFGLCISEGSISNLLQRAASKASPIYEQIQAELQTANYVGSDETGAKVNGKNWWIWTWQNVKNTFLKASPSRGSQTVEETFPGGLLKATIGSDRATVAAGPRSLRPLPAPNNYV